MKQTTRFLILAVAMPAVTLFGSDRKPTAPMKLPALAALVTEVKAAGKNGECLRHVPGVWTGPGVLAVSLRGLEGAHGALVKLPGVKEQKARGVTGYNYERDYVLLQVPGYAGRTAELAGPLAAGAALTGIDHRGVLYRGKVEGSETRRGVSYLRLKLKAPLGTPLFNERGEFAAMVTGVYADVTYALDSAEIGAKSKLTALKHRVQDVAPQRKDGVVRRASCEEKQGPPVGVKLEARRQ